MSKSFKSQVSSLINAFKSLEGFKEPYNQKVKFVKAEREYCKFEFMVCKSFPEYKKEWDKENDSNTLYFYTIMEEKFREFRDMISSFFGSPSFEYNSNDPECRHQGNGGKYYSFSTRSSFDGSFDSLDFHVQLGYIVYDYDNVVFNVSVYFYGSEVKEEKNFEVLPEIKKGTILVEYFGYNCSLCNFWKVKNRIGSTVAISRMNQTYAEGDWMNGSVVPSESTERDIYQKMIRNGSIKNERGYLYVWNGRPVCVNCD